jgi:hypothetical protein
MATRYQLTATKYAYNRLADLWVQASSSDRAAITSASHDIDRGPREDADQKDEPVNPRSPDLRRIEVHPLRAFFEVSPDDLRAIIIDYEIILPES